MRLFKLAAAVAAALTIVAPIAAQAQTMDVIDAHSATKTMACPLDSSGHLVCTATMAKTDGTPVNPASSDLQTTLINAFGSAGDSVWDGVSTTASHMALERWIAVKIGSVQSQLSSGITVNLSNLNGASTSAKQDVANGYLATISAAVGDTTTPSPVKLTDSRPASLAITAADTASTSTSGQDGAAVITGTPTANSTADFALVGQATGMLTITGTFNTGQLEIEGSADGGGASGHYATIGGIVRGAPTGTPPRSILTGPAILDLPVNALTNIRVRGLSGFAGNVTVALTASPAGGAVKVTNTVLTGSSSGSATTLIQADTSVPFQISSAATTQLVAAATGKKTYVTYVNLMAAGTANVKFVYGTGTNCGTGTTDLTKTYPLTAQVGWSGGAGLGPILVVPASQAVCVTSDATSAISGLLSETQQ